LYSGSNKAEVGYINGAVVRFGQRFGVKTPVNQILADILQQLTAGAIPIGTYKQNPEKLLELIQ
jgi:hypothetical protein